MRIPNYLTSLQLGPSAAWAFGMQEVEVVGEQIWLLGAKALAQNVQDYPRVAFWVNFIKEIPLNEISENLKFCSKK